MRTNLLQAGVALCVSVVLVGCIVVAIWKYDNWTFWAAVTGIAAMLFTLAAWKWRR